MLNAHCDFHGNQPLLATTSHPGTLSDYQITVANPRKSHAESSLRFLWQSATPSYHFPPENLELVKAPCEVTLAMAASSAGLAKIFATYFKMQEIAALLHQLAREWEIIWKSHFVRLLALKTSDYKIAMANPQKSHAECSLRFSWQSVTPSYHFPHDNLELV